jgi:hypothetical protein
MRFVALLPFGKREKSGNFSAYHNAAELQGPDHAGSAILDQRRKICQH